jgi:hypothetical protein
MLIPNKFNGYQRDGTRLLHISMGGGGGGPTQTTSTVQNTNIPAYAQGYVENMLGATQEQLFSGTRGPDVTNPETGEVTQGNFNITGFKPYQAYGGTYDAQGNQTAYDPTKGIAGFTPDQLAAQKGVMGLQVPDQFKTAGLNTESVYNDMKTNAYTAPTNLGYTASNATGLGYTAAEAAAIRAEAARLGVAPEVIAAQSNYAPKLKQYSMGPANAVGTRSFLGKGTPEAYMSPYIQNVLDVQNKELQRQSDIAGTQRGAQAVRAGAFGGSRQAIENSEANRNLAMMKNMNQMQGQQQALPPLTRRRARGARGAASAPPWRAPRRRAGA